MSKRQSFACTDRSRCMEQISWCKEKPSSNPSHGDALELVKGNRGLWHMFVPCVQAEQIWDRQLQVAVAVHPPLNGSGPPVLVQCVGGHTWAPARRSKEPRLRTRFTEPRVSSDTASWSWFAFARPINASLMVLCY